MRLYHMWTIRMASGEVAVLPTLLHTMTVRNRRLCGRKTHLVVENEVRRNETLVETKPGSWTKLMGSAAATCAYTSAIDRSSRADYRLILVLTSLANTCDGQSERRSPPTPVRTPEW